MRCVARNDEIAHHCGALTTNPIPHGVLLGRLFVRVERRYACCKRAVKRLSGALALFWASAEPMARQEGKLSGLASAKSRDVIQPAARKYSGLFVCVAGLESCSWTKALLASRYFLPTLKFGFVLWVDEVDHPVTLAQFTPSNGAAGLFGARVTNRSTGRVPIRPRVSALK